MESDVFQYYKVGNELFDSAHLHLFNMLDQMRDAIEHGNQKEIDYLKESFLSYFKSHCRWEEGLMDSSGYSNDASDFHKGHHIKTLMKVEELTLPRDVSLSMLDVMSLCNLIRDHIMIGDRELAAHINSL